VSTEAGQLHAVATDTTGSVYVLESSQIVVYKKSKLTQEIPVPSECNAGGLGIDGRRNLYISCDVQKEVFRIEPDGTTATVCSGWISPQTITSDAAGNVYVADDSEKELRECTASGALRTIATDSSISRITGLAAKGNDLYSASADKRELYKLTPP
jgi:DNA-binding beta-propeller fold protein YncE